MQARDRRWEKQTQRPLHFILNSSVLLDLLPDTHITYIILNKGHNNVKVGYMIYTQCDFNHKNKNAQEKKTRRKYVKILTVVASGWQNHGWFLFYAFFYFLYFTNFLLR